jgi:hypothetical protein
MSDTTASGLGALSGTLLGLTTVAVILRFYARWKIKSHIGTDDLLMLPAWVSLVNGEKSLPNRLLIRISISNLTGFHRCSLLA